jgi:membrane associated rhomboid family serine protease
MLTGSIIGDIKYQFRYGNMVVKLIFVNIAVFVFFGLLNVIGFLAQSNTVHDFLFSKVELWASMHTLLRQPWTVFTYMFMHDGVFHILFNMLWLYWFGEIFVLYLGDKKVLPLYIIGGLGGAFFYLLAYNLLPVFKPVLEISTLVGASASILAIVFAAATLNPDHEISLILIGPVKIKYIALVSLLIDIITIPFGNAGGYIAHVGGALTGYLYITSLRGGFDPAGSFLKLFKRKPAVKVSYKNTEAKVSNGTARSKGEQEKVDEILDKIARSGYDSLSKEEKDFLFNFSKK